MSARVPDVYVTDGAQQGRSLSPANRIAVAGAVLVVPLAAAVVIGIVAAAIGAAGDEGASAGGTATTSMPMVAPDGVLDLATVSGEVAAEYRYAADHTDAYHEMRCWCGCVDAFGHRSLADCFVRADGAWEAHGAGCAICLGEAEAARLRLDAGDAPADIARDLDAEYGPPPTTAPTGA